MGADRAPLRWGIAGPGAIARVFAEGLADSGTGVVARVHSRSRTRAARFTADFGGEPVGTLEELVGEVVDAVYVATPHPFHAETASAALEAGRAVLCEKPMTVRPDDTLRLVETARRRGVPLVEAYMYRAHPQMARMVELLESGAIGTPRTVRACFGIRCVPDLPERILSPDLAGGVVLDIGGYPLSAAMLVARTALGPGVEPTLRRAAGRTWETGVELHATAELDFDGRLTAEVACSFEEDLGLGVEVIGDAGRLRLPSAFLPEGSRHGRAGRLVLEGPEGVREERPVSATCCFGLEAAEVARLVRAGEVEPAAPMVGHRESVLLARLAEAWRAGVAGAARPVPGAADRN